MGVRFAHAPSGARIAWASSGSGPMLVRASHWMTNVEHDMASPLWAPWLARLSRQLQVVRYDARGCGLSGGKSEEPSLQSAVEDLEAVISAQQHAAPVALLGISSGAAACIAWAAANPERVARLVVLGGFPCGPLQRPLDAKQRELFEATVKLVELGWGRRNSAVQQYFTTSMMPGATLEQARALNDQQRLSCDGSHAAALMRTNASLDVRDLLPKIKCPTLVLHAADDAMVPVEQGRELASLIEGARFESLPTANHVPLAGEPAFERFCVAVESFMSEQAPAQQFTPRQREMLELVARGLDNLQIAAHLGIADKTLRNALSRLYAQLQVEGRPQAIVKARELGFGSGARS